jgi:hypothetical protein
VGTTRHVFQSWSEEMRPSRRLLQRRHGGHMCCLQCLSRCRNCIFNWIHSLPLLSTMGMVQGKRDFTDNAWWVTDSMTKQWIAYHSVTNNERHLYAQPSMQAIHEYHECMTRHDYVEYWTSWTPANLKFMWHKNTTCFRRETRTSSTFAMFGDPSTG